MKRLPTLIALLVLSNAASANLIGNGSFENTTASACDSNNSNAQFNAKMPGAISWGGANGEIDIYTAGCFGPDPVDGNRKIHLDSQGTNIVDAFSFDLTGLLTPGETYDLSFYMASNDDFGNDIGTIEIGLSDAASGLGAQVFSATSSALDLWEQFTTSFVAGADDDYLAVRAEPSGSNAWIGVDGFVLTLAGPAIPEPATLALLGLGLAGMRAGRRRRS